MLRDTSLPDDLNDVYAHFEEINTEPSVRAPVVLDDVSKTFKQDTYQDYQDAYSEHVLTSW
jgi:hypothetical protein